MAGPDAEVDRRRPWLGLDSFSESTRGFFHGRDEEVAELGRRVRRKLLTVLFGQSGLGKTSILRAGVVPRLRDEGYCPVYIRIDYGPEAPPPAQQVRMAIEAVARFDGEALPAGESLWALLHRRDGAFTDADGKPVIPLLIFDQFEEMFTLGQGDGGARARTAQFVEELADLVENRPPRALEERMESDDDLVGRYDFGREDYRILVSLREDYLAHLEQLKADMPGITQNRMRLAPMTGTQALAAVRNPGGVLVGADVAEAIVRFVAGGAETAQAQVEPALLSLICRELNDARIASGRSEISLDLLAGSHASILSDFYERAMAPHPAAVRAIVEDVLLTDSGYRENVALERIEGLFAQAGAGQGALADLVNRRLLRIEERLNLRRVELTHDVLCSVVRASRDLRQEREARVDNERMLQEQHARELATRRSLVRTRQVAAGSAVLALAAVVAFGFAWHASDKAAQAERSADTARRSAAIARSQAERLIGYLNNDFADQLVPLARQDLIESLNRRTVAYYQSLPSIEPGSEAELNRAMAMVRYGVALRQTGQFAQSGDQLSQAVRTLEARRARGDRGDATAVALAEAYLGQRRLAFAQQQMTLALEKSTAAIEVLRPVALKAGAPVGVRTLYAEILQSKGLIERNFDRQAAVATLDEAVRFYQSLYPEGSAHPVAAVAIAQIVATALPSRQFSSQQEIDAYADPGEQAVRLVLARDPTNLAAREALANLLGSRAGVEMGAHLLTRAVSHLEDSANEFERLLASDPKNQNVRMNFIGGVLSPMAWVHVKRGEPGRAVQTWKDAIARAGTSADDASFNDVKADLLTSIVWLQARSGDPVAGASLHQLREMLRMHRDGAAGDGARALLECNAAFAASTVSMTQGDLAGAMAELDKVDVRSIVALGKDPIFERACMNNVDRQAAEIHLVAGRNQDAIALLSRLDLSRSDTTVAGDADLLRESRILLVLAHLRAGDHAAAGKLVGSLLPQQRKYVALGGGNRMLEVELAALLLLQAVSSPEQGRAQVLEAHALLAALPPGLKRMVDVRRWQAMADAALSKKGSKS